MIRINIGEDSSCTQGSGYSDAEDKYKWYVRDSLDFEQSFEKWHIGEELRGWHITQYFIQVLKTCFSMLF